MFGEVSSHALGELRASKIYIIYYSGKYEKYVRSKIIVHFYRQIKFS
jgi:hypothetical protein